MSSLIHAQKAPPPPNKGGTPPPGIVSIDDGILFLAILAIAIGMYYTLKNNKSVNV